METPVHSTSTGQRLNSDEVKFISLLVVTAVVIGILMSVNATAVGGVFGIIVILGLYFFPAMLASTRGHRQTAAIFILNLFLGWTLLGWVASLVWAATNQQEESIK